MGFLRRIFSVGLGLAAGAAAYKVLNDYNKKNGHLEGEFVELPLEEAAPAAPHARVEDQRPSLNPVDLGAADRPVQADGTLDATRIADPADFGDWDDQGCRG